MIARLLLTLCCVCYLLPIHAQQDMQSAPDSLPTFSGHVVDAESGKEIPFVSISIDKKVVTMTNIDGDFSIRADAQSVLHLSYLGYERLIVKAGQMPRELKLKPLTHYLGEAVVIPEQSIVRIVDKIEKKLRKELSRHGKKKSVYFYRQLTATRTNELAEAFILAKNAVNLRELTALSGHHGRKTAVGLTRPLIADMNFHHPLELGPMTEGADYWKAAVRPFSKNYERSKFDKTQYKRTLKIIKGDEGRKVYAITFAPRNPDRKGAMMTGTVYVDAKTYELLSFDGKMRGMALDIKKDFVRQSSPISLDLHIKYRHTKKYTEVENLSYSLQSGDLLSNAFIFNVDDIDADLGKGSRKRQKAFTENMLANLDDAQFDDILSKHAYIVQRTEEEIETAESDQVSDLLTTHYNIPNKASRTTWNIHLPDTKLGNLTNRLAKMGQVLPQEKVYVHLDNNCYFIGDSIWFSAYLRRTSDDQMSNISGILYVELLNPDGYVLQRKLIDTKDGHGHGAFYLDHNWFAGYYEIRAYTRWQLNWGAYELKHGKKAEAWFINKEMEHSFYRDYEKLYSRVFPVYNPPQKAGQYNRTMFTRPLTEYFRKDPDAAKLQVKLYPEGGELIEGVPCRVAFEAIYTDGRYADGELTIDMGKDRAPIKAKTKHRGRGVFTFTPRKEKLTASFQAVNAMKKKQGNKVSVKIPKTESDGVALQIQRRDSVWEIQAHAVGKAFNDSLGITLMHEGRVRFFWEMNEPTIRLTVNDADLECGVNQVTVFDQQGHTFADRLFFVSRPNLGKPSLTVSGVKKFYEPYEEINLQVSMDEATAKAATNRRDETSGTISISVHDKDATEQLFDNASIQAEMLLSSEIRGFVPTPDWYFRKDDQEHREALDLLMMTQGWRRFDWRQMAVRGAWDLTQPDERTPIIIGRIYDFNSGFFYNPSNMPTDDASDESATGFLKYESKDLQVATGQKFVARIGAYGLTEKNEIKNTLEFLSAVEKERQAKANGRKIPSSVRVHAELVSPTKAWDPLVVEMGHKNGMFRITLPKIYEPSAFFLAASDTAKWKKGKQYEWIQDMPNEELKRKFRSDDAEFSLRVDYFYPRYVKAYNYFQQRTNYLDERSEEGKLLDDGTHLLGEAGVRGKRRMSRSLNDTIPALIVDAYDAYNYALDAGITNSSAIGILRAYVGDYGLEDPYALNEYGSPDSRLHVIKGADGLQRLLNGYTLNEDSVSIRKNLFNDRIDRYSDIYTYGSLANLEKYIIYSDYRPRYFGSNRYYGANLPDTYIAICPFPDYSQRMLYRDRFYMLPLVETPDEFYSPDYSQRPLPEEPTDYRRTLYWNPALKLNKEGKATVKLWNNSRMSRIDVSTEGMTNNGQPLTNK